MLTGTALTIGKLGRGGGGRGERRREGGGYGNKMSWSSELNNQYHALRLS